MSSKLTLKRCASALLLCLSLVHLPSHAAPARTLVLYADEWCPHNCRPGGGAEGYLVDITRRIFADSGYTIRYEVLNWARIATLARTRPPSNEVWAVLALGSGSRNEALYALPKEASGRSPYCFFTRNELSWQYKSLDSLQGVRLGVANGYHYNEEIDAVIARMRQAGTAEPASGAAPLQVNLQKLLYKRIDVQLDDSVAMKYELHRSGHEADVRMAGCLPSADDYLYIGFSKVQPEALRLAARVTRGMKHLRESGELQHILGSYGLRDWQPHR